jgi:hypothetical protein
MYVYNEHTAEAQCLDYYIRTGKIVTPEELWAGVELAMQVELVRGN